MIKFPSALEVTEQKLLKKEAAPVMKKEALHKKEAPDKIERDTSTMEDIVNNTTNLFHLWDKKRK